MEPGSGFLAGAEKGLYPKDDFPKAGLHATNHLMLAYITHEATQHLGEAYLQREWNQFEHTVLRIDGPPSIAVNAMISTDLYSDVLDAAAYTLLNVFPLDNGTVAIFSKMSIGNESGDGSFSKMKSTFRHRRVHRSNRQDRDMSVSVLHMYV